MKGKKMTNKINVNAGTNNNQTVSQNKNCTKSKRRASGGKSTNRRSNASCDSSTDSNDTNKNYGNDASWYTANPQLLKDATALSFYVPMGSKLPGVNSMPGIMTLHYTPSFGVSTSAGSPINIAARNVYSYIRHANSGHTNYESPDLMMYLLAMDSAYAFHAWMCRLYGVTSLYSQTNKYLPEGLVRAMGVDYDDLITKLSDLRYYINQYAVKLGSLVVPSTWSYYKRHIWMCSNMYMDEDSIKPQIYLYNPDGYYQFQETAVETGSALLFKKLDANATVAKIISFGNMLIDALVNSEDINIMSGDILKAYGAETMKVGSIPSDYTVMPVYNTEVLQQMHNVRLTGDLNDLKVTQVDGVIKFNPAIANSKYWVMLKREALLDMFTDVPTPEDIIVATRGIVATDPSSPTSGGNLLGTAGTEIFTKLTIYTYNAGAYDSVDTDVIIYDTFGNAQNTGISFANVSTLLKLTTFSKAPFVYVSTSNTAFDAFGNFENYTTIPYQTLYNMHETALLSMFDVPQMGRAR